LLNLEKLMNKGQEKLEKMIALVLLAYAIGLLVGEKWKLYSGLFIRLKQQVRLARQEVPRLVTQVLFSFRQMVSGYVPSHV